MSVKIYNAGASIITENVYGQGSKQSINSVQFDWKKIGNKYFVRDNIEKKTYELGVFSNIQNEAGTPYSSDTELETALNGFVNVSGGTAEGVNSYSISGSNNLALDAWGRQKSVADRSLIHGMFTTSVPVATWKESLNGTELAVFSGATSINGKLSLRSGDTLNDVRVLDSFRNPRYEPNRGHLYSTAMFIPDKTALGQREFGIFTELAGVFFRIKSDGNLYAVIRTTVDSVTTDNEQLIDLTVKGIDIEKGNVYDIQFQWRGVGNYKFFINLQEVFSFNLIGTLTELSMFNPALPIAFSCKNLGDNVELNCGCVDVTSEGGSNNGKIYGSIGIDNISGQTPIDGFNIPVLVIKSEKLIRGERNTRDTLALIINAYSDQRSFIRVWVTRDFSAITPNDQVWRKFGDGHLEFITYDVPDVTAPMTFDTAKAAVQFGTRVDQDAPFQSEAIFDGRASIWLTPGDMFIFTMHRETGASANVGCTFEFAEEI